MAFKVSLLIILTITALFISNAYSVKDIPTAAPQPGVMELQAAGEMPSCWSALTELTMCSNEIIAFFLNGQAEMDEPCCKAIGVIAERCGLALIGSLGFTAEEGNLLEVYCEKFYGGVQDGSALPVLVQSPAPSTLVN